MCTDDPGDLCVGADSRSRKAIAWRLEQGVTGRSPPSIGYDGDGITDFAVWRPSDGTWYVIPSSNPSSPIIQQWGQKGDIPVPGDYDHDAKTDVAVWRPSNGTWFIIPSSAPTNLLITQWGTNGDVPVQKPIRE